jgi:hypothetical protein
LKRRAKALQRQERIPLHAALDRIAREEGYARWSLLAAKRPAARPAGALFAGLDPGDLLLVAARPRQGKTLLGLELMVESAKAGRRAVVLSLEDTQGDVFGRLRAIGLDDATLTGAIDCDCSDAISADYIVDRLATADFGTLVVVDYLQLLDQKRDNPALDAQIRTLRIFARAKGLILVFLSQIDRSFDLSDEAVPGPEHVRLPNPLDLRLFDKACFLHQGRMRFTAAA